MLKRICLSTCILTALSGCASLPNVGACTAAGNISSGAICAETLSSRTWDMDMDEYIDFLEPKASYTDPDTGQVVPARSGAICQSSVDWNRLKTAAEKMCRELGARCKPEVVQAIKELGRIKKLLKVK